MIILFIKNHYIDVIVNLHFIFYSETLINKVMGVLTLCAAGENLQNHNIYDIFRLNISKVFQFIMQSF
jgi:hypothetical protein